MSTLAAWVCAGCDARWATKLTAGCPRCQGELNPLTPALVRRPAGTRKGKKPARPVARG